MGLILNSLRRIKHGSLRRWRKAILALGERRVLKRARGTVVSGVFAGTKLIDGQVFGSKVAKFLGTYELELQDHLADVVSRKPKVVCNVGGAEGYYAMGFARLEGVKEVIVYEALAAGRQLIKENAATNGVDSVIKICETCSEQSLYETLQQNKVDLLLIDIEGAELDILTAKNIALLNDTELLIESHDFCRPNCLEVLTSLFSQTHTLTTFTSRRRSASDFPLNSWLPGHIKISLMDEMRPDDMTWLACLPKSRNILPNLPSK